MVPGAAALYRLDFMTKKAELEWQYELETQLRDGSHNAAEGEQRKRIYRLARAICWLSHSKDLK